MRDETKLLTVQDLCELFGVTRQTIRNWTRKGALLPPIRVGGRRCYWRADDVGMWLRRHPPTRFQYHGAVFPLERDGSSDSGDDGATLRRLSSTRW